MAARAQSIWLTLRLRQQAQGRQPLQCPHKLPKRVHEARGDAFSAGDIEGKCLLLDCKIYGGSEGMHIGGSGVHLKRTEVRFAQSRGIFSRRPFVIEDSTVDSCGGHEVKGTAG